MKFFIIFDLFYYTVHNFVTFLGSAHLSNNANTAGDDNSFTLSPTHATQTCSDVHLASHVVRSQILPSRVHQRDRRAVNYALRADVAVAPCINTSI